MTKAVLKGAALGALILSGALAASQAALADDARSYEVTIRNATLGQPIAPSLFVTHNSGFSMFTIGDTASTGLATLAETGSPGVLVTEVDGASGVDDVVVLLFPNNDTPDDPPIMLPGESNSTMISASGNAKYFSAVGMLVATNDAFYALRGVRLPKHGSITVHAAAYDAGSEANTEALGDIPAGGNGAFDDPTGDEEGYIHVHAGIHEVGDLDPAVHDWRNPVVEITITRVDDD